MQRRLHIHALIACRDVLRATADEIDAELAELAGEIAVGDDEADGDDAPLSERQLIDAAITAGKVTVCPGAGEGDSALDTAETTA